MKVIAFDTECSRDYGNYCEMCSFGFVIADFDLEVELSKSTLIKASKPTGRQKKAVKFDTEKLQDAPDYRAVYPLISEIFSHEDTIFVSHSPETDFRYLCCMNRRYNKEDFSCKAFDILSIVGNYADLPNYSLSGICHTFGLKYSRKDPNANAKACIDILRYICREEKTSVQDLLSVCGKNAVVDSEVINHRTQLGFKKARFDKYYHIKPNVKGKFTGLVFSLSESFEDRRIETGFRIAKTIVEYGGTITRKVSESDVFVWDGSLDSKRLESVNMDQKQIRVITTDELFSSEFPS